MQFDTRLKPVFFGIEGYSLTEEEKHLFSKNTPLGFILFDRNVRNVEQLKELTDELRQITSNENIPILVDQEGGRICRLWPPDFTGIGWCSTYGDWWIDGYKKHAISGVISHSRSIAKDFKMAGINTDCYPCLDVRSPESAQILQKRFFSDQPEIVSELANVAIEELLKQKIMPVAKHFPGYGRAVCDPHQDLPIVKATLTELEKDFYPFKNLVDKDIFGMTAHCIYQAIDEENPSTLSRKVISFIRSEIGFNGLLMCDDISMGALKYPLLEKSLKALDAGCDAVLHCNGNIEEMKALLMVLPDISEQSLKRYITGLEKIS